VEWLAAGDEVWTFEGTAQPLRWVGHRRLSARDVARHPKLRPVWIGEGAPAQGAPGHGLCVAPDTQLLLTGPKVSLNFGLDQALVQAGDLINPPPMHGNSQGLTYFMLLFDKHEVLLANGQLCASLFADAGVRDLLARQFSTLPPDIRHHRFALPCLTEWEAGIVRAGQIFGKPQRLVVAA